ncbi:MAG: amino acid ABC transporter substrate-binding protein [Pseudomonadota bacterium]|nr:amino acid ABC transporter substrate-binding protein [Pseudomonadota bacterium]
MKNKQGILGQARAFLVASLVLWCTIGLQAALAGEPIRVGVTASLSGVYAGPGKNQLQGIEMWAHDINARGALLGREVELVYYDDASDPDTVRRLYQQLINDDKVDLLIGPYSSDLTLVASDVAEQHDFPMVAAGAASSRIWSRGYRNIFQVDAPAREYMDLLIKSAKENAGLTQIALVYPAAEFSRQVAEGVRAKAAEHGMEIVFDEEYPLDSTEFSDLVRRMRLSAPELVIGATYLNDSIAFVQEAKRQQLSPQAFAFTVGPALPEFGNALGDDADGIIGVVSWMRSGRVPMAYDFSFRFKEKFGRNAGAHAAYGYGAGQVLEAGVRLAGSLDRDAIRQQLRDMVFRSLLGNYRVDDTGMQKAKTIFLMQWQNGYRLLVSPPELRDAEIIYPFKPWSER